MFANAHESEVPPQLTKEKTIDIYNNTQGINYGTTLTQTTTDITVQTAIMIMVTQGLLQYLSPLLPPDQDPTYAGTPAGTQNLQTATHGITNATQLIPTNQ